MRHGVGEWMLLVESAARVTHLPPKSRTFAVGGAVLLTLLCLPKVRCAAGS